MRFLTHGNAYPSRRHVEIVDVAFPYFFTPIFFFIQ